MKPMDKPHIYGSARLAVYIKRRCIGSCKGRPSGSTFDIDYAKIKKFLDEADKTGDNLTFKISGSKTEYQLTDVFWESATNGIAVISPIN